MAKTLTFRIKSLDDAFTEFRDTFKAVHAGRRVRRTRGTYFTSIDAARNFLTPSRLALLSAVRSKRPGSIYELAKMVERDLKNVQDDLRLLEQYGLVEMSHGKGTGKRRVRVPRTKVEQIALKIAI